MKSLFATMCAALVLSAGVAGAATTLLDGAEDTVYTSTVGTGESVSFANVPGSEGTNALEITYNYTTEAAWFKNGVVTKTFATPVDLTAMEALEFDLNVPTPNAGFMLIMMLTDDQGFVTSTNFYPAFSSSTTGFQTFSAPMSTFVKNQWKAQGRAANLRKIKSIGINFPNQGNVTAGTFVFSIDNVKMVHGLSLLNETMLEDFESFADSTALSAAYPVGTGTTDATGISITLDTANPYAGAKALKMEGTFAGQWYTLKATYTLPSPIDVSTAKYFKISAHGNANMFGYNPTVDIILIDNVGNHLIGHTWLWGEKSEWATFYMPFLNAAAPTATWGCWVETKWDAGGEAGLCDLTNIAAIRLQLSPQAEPSGSIVYPITTSAIFDNIVIGDDTTVASVKDWSLY